MGCCVSFIKYLMFIFNVIFWLAGGALLGLGIYLKVNKDMQHIIIVAGIDLSSSAAIALIVFGSIVFVIGFFGCCGAIKESRCLLGTYFALVLIIFLAQVAVVIWIFVSRGTLEKKIRQQLTQRIPIDESDITLVTSLQKLEQTLQCCGLVNGCSDWKNGVTQGCSCTTNSANCVPVKSLNTTCSSIDNADNIYQLSCFDAVLRFIQNNITLVAGVAVGIALLEIFGMIFAMIMCTNTKSEYDTY